VTNFQEGVANWRTFNLQSLHIYRKWSRAEPVPEDEMTAITSAHITEEEFSKLTECRELAKYIALIDYNIRFDHLPKAPNGEVAGYTVSTTT
jgi:hypothetical protein